MRKAKRITGIVLCLGLISIPGIVGGINHGSLFVLLYYGIILSCVGLSILIPWLLGAFD